MKVIAEIHGVLVERTDALAKGERALVERLDRMERKFEIRFDVLESRFTRLETKVDGLEVFASDAQGRLKRIETHLQLKRASRSAPRLPYMKPRGAVNTPFGSVVSDEV